MKSARLQKKIAKILSKKGYDLVLVARDKEKLEEVTLKNDDNEKKLKLSNQAYDYLNSSLLKINNNLSTLLETRISILGDIVLTKGRLRL